MPNNARTAVPDNPRLELLRGAREALREAYTQLAKAHAKVSDAELVALISKARFAVQDAQTLADILVRDEQGTSRF